MQQEATGESKSALPRFFTLEMFMFTVTALSGLVCCGPSRCRIAMWPIMVCAGVVFTLSIVVVIRLIMDPDSVRARQSDSMLKLASQTLTCMNDGMDYEAAQKICGLLLPSTAAIAVAITDKKQILGYAGYEEAQNLPGSIIRTHATHATLADGKLRILFTPEEIGFPTESSSIKAAIIVPLKVGPQRGGHAQVLLPPGEEHQRDAEVHRRGVRQAAFHADGGLGAGGADEAGHQHGAEDAAKPDQPALPVQHHQHHRLAHSHRPRDGAQAAARVRRVLPPNARRLRRPHRVRARDGADEALLHVRSRAFRRRAGGDAGGHRSRCRGDAGAAVPHPTARGKRGAACHALGKGS